MNWYIFIEEKKFQAATQNRILIRLMGVLFKISDETREGVVFIWEFPHRYIWIIRYLLKSQTWATSPMTSWCSTRRWWSTASFFPVVFGNSLSQKIHGTWSSRFEISFTGCSGNAKTSKPCCVWIPVTKYSISKYLHEIIFYKESSPLSAMFITRLSLGNRIFEKRHFMYTYTILFWNSRSISRQFHQLVPCDSYPCPGFAPIFELELSSHG